jgi:N-acetyl-gamma-glutamyl-phosphate reductase
MNNYSQTVEPASGAGIRARREKTLAHVGAAQPAASPARTGIVGATGYAGIELVKLLARHPRAILVAAMSSGGAASRHATHAASSHPEAKLGAFVPALRGIADIECRPASPAAMLEAKPDFVFLATPHEVSMEWAPRLLDAGIRVIDLSGAFRFRDAAVFESWYKMAHAAPELLSQAVYGWPEINRPLLAGAQLVANPGCYATAAAAALRPLFVAGLAADAPVICDAKSGASGAGKGLREDLSFVELEANFKAYGVFSHRHTPEIAEQTGIPLERLTFTPHLLPVARGILATCYVELVDGVDEAAVAAAYAAAYGESPLVRVTGSDLPELKHVVHTNFCDIGYRVDGARGRAIVVSCLDNLLKGAAGQAVQNFNCMLGIAEETALL